MSKPRVHVWGKHGCAKCKALMGRLERLNKEGLGVDVVYHDILTVEGLAEFCRHGSINGNNIPAMTVEGADPLENPECWPWRGSKPLYGECGVCTDYDNGGVMLPEMLVWVIDQATK